MVVLIPRFSFNLDLKMGLCSYKMSYDIATVFQDINEMPSYIQTGIRLAKRASRACTSNYCIGACAITRNPTSYNLGICSTRSHPLQKRFCGMTEKINLHAEIEAISRTRDYEIDTMVVVRTLKKKGDFAISRPCDICFSAMTSFNVGSVVFFEKEIWHRIYL